MEKYVMLKQAFVKLQECLQTYTSQRNSEAGLVDHAIAEELKQAFEKMQQQLESHSVMNRIKKGQ